MNKIPTDLTMTWFTHTLEAGLFPDEVWVIISWIAFFFKLASLAFAVPLIGLIIFDFCLWVWRLNRPQPKDASRSSRISSQTTERKTNSKPTGSATSFATKSATSQRRPKRSEHTDD
ncbi:uncharacterized protein F4822DRAFT_282744 [Hypoxylon trugodes]|uniref:uncharacterized protein n=1 Tax=Hypoxylon trugodes TaxID=326681 RepID=UPI0021A05511|nr:uncharacterized protein F4822DRAFT_282744 [Hypoxylon trugodes]KAI1387446.1 hypothetical protein F4822DRAFT_282744 [Hypoxylon trugodes]